MNHQPVIGVIGGGQLGRMFIEEALRYNIKCIIVDADKNCPASVIAHEHIVGSITAREPILALAAKCDVLTYEIEHIYIDALLELEEKGIKLFPSPRILQMVQDKGLQKKFYADNEIPTAPFVIVNSKDEWIAAAEKSNFEKFAAKLCREGYDGKGVALISLDEIKRDFTKIPFAKPTVLEKFIECEKELAVIVARNIDGEISCFPCVEMEFDANANLVKYLLCPAQIDEATLNQAETIAKKVVEKLNGVGIFAVEMFLDKDKNIFVNEMAPRPHNSGHHTIEACYTSQYEQLLRILTGLPLGSTRLIKPAVMLNILGADNVSGEYFLSGLDALTKTEGVYVHLYNKKETRPMRKLGHITILADTVEEVKAKAELVSKMFTISPLKK